MLQFCVRAGLPRPAFLITVFWVFPLVFSIQVNRTIDDTYGDSATGLQVVYSVFWNTGQLCPGCAVQPNPAEAFAGSWHDTTSSAIPHNATMKFVGMARFRFACRGTSAESVTGTAIWVYGILVNSGASGVTIYTNASFELDGYIVGTYHHIPDPSDDKYLYNVTVFSQHGLSNTEHTLLINVQSGSETSLFLFDWAIYTYVTRICGSIIMSMR